MLKFRKVNLFVFNADGEGSAATDTTPAGEGDSKTADKGVADQELFEPVYEDSNVDDGTEVNPDNENTENPDNSDNRDDVDLDSEFDDLIKGKYKTSFENRIKASMDKRFKPYKAMQARNAELEPLYDLLKESTGQESVSDIIKAFEEENLEDLAMKAGYTDTTAFKKHRELERKINELSTTRNVAPEAAESAAKSLEERWLKEQDTMQKEFPGFKIVDYLPTEENQSPEALKFAEKLRLGFDVESAYVSAYRKQLFSKVQTETKKQTAQNIKNRKNRPSESASNKRKVTGFKVKQDISKMSSDEILEFRKEIRKKKKAGENIIY